MRLSSIWRGMVNRRAGSMTDNPENRLITAGTDPRVIEVLNRLQMQFQRNPEIMFAHRRPYRPHDQK